MAKKKCAVCGTILKPEDLRCKGCGMPQIDLNNLTKKKLVDCKKDRVNTVDKTLDERVSKTIERLDLYAKLIKVYAFIGWFLLIVYSIFSSKWLLLIGCGFLYFLLPFLSLPISWMQLMLENINYIKNK